MMNNSDEPAAESCPNHLSELEAAGFVHVDSLSLAAEDDGFRIQFGPASRDRNARHPSVYAWVVCTPGRSEVIYVGMASQGWRVRRGQHAGGLKTAEGAGAKNRLGLVAALQGKGVVKVFERRATEATLFGVRAPMHGAEEWALIARFRPPLNKPTDVERAVRFAGGSIRGD